MFKLHIFWDPHTFLLLFGIIDGCNHRHVTWCKNIIIYHKCGFIVGVEGTEDWYTTALHPWAWALLLGDFHIPLDNPSSSDFLSLNRSFDVTPLHLFTELDLILAHCCVFDTLQVTHLHFSENLFMQFNLRLTSPLLPIPRIFLHHNPSKVSPTHFSMLVRSTLPTSSAISSPMLMIPPMLFPLLWDHPWNVFVLYPPGLLGLWSNRCGTTDTHKLFSTFKSLLIPPVPSYLNNLVGARATPRPLPSWVLPGKVVCTGKAIETILIPCFLMVGRPRGLHQSRGNPLFLQ